jgi:hypothetical protein
MNHTECGLQRVFANLVSKRSLEFVQGTDDSYGYLLSLRFQREVMGSRILVARRRSVDLNSGVQSTVGRRNFEALSSELSGSRRISTMRSALVPVRCRAQGTVAEQWCLTDFREDWAYHAVTRE